LPFGSFPLWSGSFPAVYSLGSKSVLSGSGFRGFGLAVCGVGKFFALSIALRFSWSLIEMSRRVLWVIVLVFLDKSPQKLRRFTGSMFLGCGLSQGKYTLTGEESKLK